MNNIFGISRDLIALPIISFLPFRQECLDRWFSLGEWRDEYDADNDNMFVQIIPCICIIYQGTYFVYRQGIRGHYLMYVDGHITQQDSDQNTAFIDLFWNCLCRELFEKIGLVVEKDNVHLLGFLQDTSNNMSHPHLGIVGKVFIDNPNLSGEQDMLVDRQWLPFVDIQKQIVPLNAWTQILCRKVWL